MEQSNVTIAREEINSHLPKQSTKVGQIANVYVANTCMQGEIVRDDIEKPYCTIIKLPNGKYVLGTECQYFV